MGQNTLQDAAEREAPGAKKPARRGLVRLLPFLGPAFVAAVAYVDPSDQYIGAPLRTRSTFGCILWKAKP